MNTPIIKLDHSSGDLGSTGCSFDGSDVSNVKTLSSLVLLDMIWQVPPVPLLLGVVVVNEPYTTVAKDMAMGRTNPVAENN